MKLKTLVFVLLSAVSAHAAAVSVSVDYSGHYADTKDGSANLSGVGVEVSSHSAAEHGWYARAEYQRSGSWDADVVEVQGGYRYSFYSRDSVSVSGRVGVGVASADIDAYRNTNQFVTLPLAVEVGYRPTEKFEVYGRAGYKWAFDVTSDNTCRDGSGSNSSGRGTCSWHGGVSHRSDKVGTVHGPTLNVGVRYNF